MSGDTPPQNNEDNTPPKSGSTFVLSRGEFDQIPGYRAKYIVLYIMLCVWWMGPRIVAETTGFSLGVTHYLIVYFGLYGLFAYWFMRTLRTLQFNWIVIIPSAVVVFLPLPGLFAMAYMDRKIADQWDKADDAHQKYRQRIYPGDEEDEDPEEG